MAYFELRYPCGCVYHLGKQAEEKPAKKAKTKTKGKTKTKKTTKAKKTSPIFYVRDITLCGIHQADVDKTIG